MRSAKQMIEEIKDRTGWTTNRVAKEMRLTPSTLYRIEYGSRANRLTELEIAAHWKKIMAASVGAES